MTVNCDQIHSWLRRLYGGESRRLTRFTNIGHPPCVMNLPPVTINVLSSKAFAFRWNVRRSWVLQPFEGLNQKVFSKLGLILNSGHSGCVQAQSIG